MTSGGMKNHHVNRTHFMDFLCHAEVLLYALSNELLLLQEAEELKVKLQVRNRLFSRRTSVVGKFILASQRTLDRYCLIMVYIQIPISFLNIPLIQKASKGDNTMDKTVAFLSFKLFSIELHPFVLYMNAFLLTKG